MEDIIDSDIYDDCIKVYINFRKGRCEKAKSHLPFLGSFFIMNPTNLNHLQAFRQ